MNDLVQRPDLSDVVPEWLTEILERERQRQFLEQLQILRHPARADRVDAQIDHRLVGHSLFPSPRNIARSADYGRSGPCRWRGCLPARLHHRAVAPGVPRAQAPRDAHLSRM